VLAEELLVSDLDESFMAFEGDLGSDEELALVELGAEGRF